MKDVLLKVAAQMASQELSEQDAIAKVVSLGPNLEVWQQLITAIVLYEEQPAMALSLTELLCAWAQRQFAQEQQQQALVWKGWASLLVSDLQTAISCLDSVYEEVLACMGTNENLQHCSDLLTHIGQLYQKAGKFREAIKCFEQAREVLRQGADRIKLQTEITPSDDIFDEEPLLDDVGQESAFPKDQNDNYPIDSYSKYQELLNQACEQYHLQAIYQNHLQLGKLALKDSDWESARNSFTKGIEVLEKMRIYYPLLSSEFVIEHAEIFGYMIRCCIESNSPATALHFLEQHQRWTFLARIPERILLERLPIGDEWKIDYQNSIEKLQLCYQTLRSKLEHSDCKTPDAETRESIHAYEAHLEELRTKIEVFDPEWTKLYGYPFRFDPAELQASLTTGTLVVYIYPIDDQMHILLVDNRQLEIVSCKMPEKFIEELCQPLVEMDASIKLWQQWCLKNKLGPVKEFQQLEMQLANSKWHDGNEARTAWKAHLDTIIGKLSQFFIPQLLPKIELQQADRLVLIPYNLLSTLPLHLLTIDSQGENIALQDRYEIVYAPSALLFMKSKQQVANTDNVLFVTGYPGKQLQFFAEELQRIPSIWSGETIRKIHDKATPENICEKAKRASHIHLGAYANISYPDSINSSILVSAEEPGEVFCLRVPHILEKFSLQTEVLTIAAPNRECTCDKTGSNMGLTAAFLYAGVRTVLTGLWPVPDIAAYFLMDKFYQGLVQGLRPAMALYEAQSEIRRMTIRNIYEQLLEQEKSVSLVKRPALKKVCTLLKGDESQLSATDREDALAIVYAFRDPITAGLESAKVRLADFLYSPMKISEAESKFSNLESRPFEHVFYWGGFYCSGAGLTEIGAAEDAMDASRLVYVEELGVVQDEDVIAQDIAGALSNITDEGLKSCEPLEETLNTHPELHQEAQIQKTLRKHIKNVKARCPSCDRKIRCKLAAVGGVAKCPHCGTKVRIPPRTSPFDDIKVAATCPHCAENIHCFLPMAGRRAKCPSCNQKVRIPKREILLAEIAASDLTSRVVLLND